MSRSTLSQLLQQVKQDHKIITISCKNSLTCLFLTWCGHPAGMKTASPRFCSNVQGSMPEEQFKLNNGVGIILQ